ncbi:olfactory receptor 52N5-like [Scomber japonicus]|uniref:olfactory receptor 52N5-like n=1 Tax=Scomber japonicus TaxID=13676 RepID=UPI002305D2E3|nr:olfactory receptor 52N5-like [Scomber japonicus]
MKKTTLHHICTNNQPVEIVNNVKDLDSLCQTADPKAATDSGSGKGSSLIDPLQYNTRMTSKSVAVFIAVIWFPPILVNFFTLPLIVPLQLCGNIINKVYCDNHSVVKLSCYDTTVNNIFGLIVTAVSVFGPLILILYTYMMILKVCSAGCKQSRQKAVSTCTPHLVSLLNFTFGACFEILQSRFNMSGVPNALRIFLSLYFLTCPPILNPLMYGLKLSKIRVTCKSLISNVGL